MIEQYQVLFLIVVGFSAGFIDAIAGGGGLISLPSLLALGLPPVTALGTNKAIGISTAIAASGRYILSRIVTWGTILLLAILALILSFIGAYVASVTSPAVLRPMIVVGLICVAIYTMRKRRLGECSEPPPASRAKWMVVVVCAAGFYDGFFGPGTGTFLIIGFVLLWGQNLLQASANGRIINLATNLGAIILFSYRGYVDFTLVAPAAAASFVGGLVGASWAIKHGSKVIRPIFLIVTWALILKVAWDLFGT